MDELIYIQNIWKSTDSGRIFIEGVWDTSYMCKEISKIEEILRKQDIARKQQTAYAMNNHDAEMSDDNNTEEA